MIRNNSKSTNCDDTKDHFTGRVLMATKLIPNIPQKWQRNMNHKEVEYLTWFLPKWRVWKEQSAPGTPQSPGLLTWLGHVSIEVLTSRTLGLLSWLDFLFWVLLGYFLLRRQIASLLFLKAESKLSQDFKFAFFDWLHRQRNLNCMWATPAEQCDKEWSA